mgnify:CR=1 FL=1
MTKKFVGFIGVGQVTGMKCAVINCGKILEEGKYVTIGGKRYCKECAVLIAKEELSQFSTYTDPKPESNE